MGIEKTGADSMSSTARSIRHRMGRGYATNYSKRASLSLVEALRAAAQVGIADVSAGRVQGFGSPRELGQHFDAIAESAIASVR
ncbi:hypothetical protein NDK50_22675 [Paraburkholderia bryophila]|uniref:hypothetical protein n=1 Tax=Paraburkholderia bryophila TaxID=420952 RepID=UPI0023499BE2|nr:hypothetical protein [Paraburkholderia bryophila]WCM23661.1 hypothetical protein NDK50_22675 [Paraburkholderia bryophila]